MAAEKKKTSNRSAGKNTNTKTTNSKPTNKKTTNTKGTNKKSATKKTSRSKNKATENATNFDMHREIVILATITLSIFLIVTIYFSTGAIVGRYVRVVCFGLFGIGAYLVPVLVIAIAVLFIVRKDYEKYINKLILSFFLIVAFSTLAHIIVIDSEQITDVIDDKSAFFPSLSNYFNLAGEFRSTGGLIGGLIGDLIVVLVDKLGGILLSVLVITALIIVIFETSVINFFMIIYKASAKAIKGLLKSISSLYSSQKEKNQKRKEKRINELAERDKYKPKKEDLKQPKQSGEKNKVSFLDKALVTEKKATEIKTSKNNGGIVQETPNKSKKLDNIQISLFNNDKKDEKKESKKDKVENLGKTSFDIDVEIQETESAGNPKMLYEYPPVDLLLEPPDQSDGDNKDEVRYNAQKLQDTLESFGVGANVVNVSCGPTVTRYELQPEVGVKVSKIVNLTDDIALNLAASGIRIEAPIPGKALIGIEVPNKNVKSVFIKEVITSDDFMKFPSKIAFVVGKDISGETIIADIGKMPHMLISGATGSGKSVCINTLITSILFRAHPDEVKLLMIDPKVVELKVYNGIPHLLIPVVTDAKKAAGALYWAVKEMEDRYQLFAAANVRDLTGYNKAVVEKGEGKKLPQIVVIVDELADLMQVAAKEVEDAICRLAQMARAAGIHLILATQRPSVDVITGIIKANIPSRIAFSVSSGVDSRTIIDMNGAEKLVGKGDMLYYPIGMNKPLRVQGAFISDHEVENIVNFLKATEKAEYDNTIIEQINKVDSKSSAALSDDDVDEYFEQALEMVVEKQKASASMLQRKFKVGFNRASRIVEQLYEAGYIGDEEGSKPRKVLLTQEGYYQLKHSQEQSEEADGNDIIKTAN